MFTLSDEVLTVLFISGYVFDRTERLATEGDSRYYDARREDLGAVRTDARPQSISRTPIPFGIP